MNTSKFLAALSLLAVGYFFGQLHQSVPSPISAVQAADHEQAKPAYIYVTGKDYDPEQLVPYVTGLAKLYEQYEGSYLAVSRDYLVLEGEHDYQSVVVTKWPSLEQAKAFWYSPEYEQLRKLREGLGTFHAVAFEGFATERKAAPLAE